MEPPAATTTAGIYCKTCGYDLRGSLEGGRCPECGCVFSPDDPKSFRTRPFAASWQRTLGRWVKRTAILFLVLLIFVGGPSGWLYWDGRRDRLALWKMQRGSAVASCGLMPLGGIWWPWRLTGWKNMMWRCTYVGLRPYCDDSLLPLLRDLRYLQTLDLHETRITDAGLLHLAQLPALQRLDLSLTRITDAGLIHLETLAALRALTLVGTDVTDAGLVHLEKLQTLEHLDLRLTRITPAGAGRLRAALPGCTIVGP